MTTATLLTIPDSPAPHAWRAPRDLQLKMLPATARAEALSEWRRLEHKLSNQRLACSSLWTEIWLNHYGSLVPHQFAIAMRDGIACGIVLMTRGVDQHAGPITLNTWHVGTAGEPDSDSVCVEYNALLVAPEDHAEFGCTLWKWVREATNCDEFRMDGFDAPAVELLVARNPQATIQRIPSHFFDLVVPRSTGEDPLMRLGSHTRGNIRKTLRELGDARGEWAETPGRAEELFHQMVKLHQQRWRSEGRPGVYASHRFHEFHRELLTRAVTLGWSTIFAVTVANRLIGCCQVLIDKQRVLLYQCGRAPATGRASHGLALDYLCITEALRRGYDAVDFLAGDSNHKRRLSTNVAEMAWVVWQRANVKNAAIGALRRVKRAATQLWQLNAQDHKPLTVDQLPFLVGEE